MADPWDWQDDGFKLDGESPLEITRCLWDELPQSEEDSRSLFSTPLTDISTQDPSFYSLRGQDADTLAHRFCNTGLQGGGSSPRMKRRRLLFCEPDPIYDNCDTHAESDSVIESFTTCIDPLMQVCSAGLQQSMDVNSLQSDSFWYRSCDEMPATFDGGVEPGCNNWMSKPVADRESNDCAENNLKICSVWSGQQQSLPGHEEDAIQGPGTPLPGRCTMYISDIIDNNTGVEAKKQQLSPSISSSYTRFCTPVAYPFTLLKPSEAEGDITLKDINQRILMPPSRPLPHLQQLAVDESCWPAGGCFSPTDPGLGLSGKSVVARTKIHTEGNGTITIMRTRG